MQDKIQEIMGLVKDYGEACMTYGAGGSHVAVISDKERAIQSKLSELLREPLSEKEIEDLHNKVSLESDYGSYDVGFFIDFTREV